MTNRSDNMKGQSDKFIVFGAALMIVCGAIMTVVVVSMIYRTPNISGYLSLFIGIPSMIVMYLTIKWKIKLNNGVDELKRVRKALESLSGKLNEEIDKRKQSNESDGWR